MQITIVTMLTIQTTCITRKWFLYRVMSYYNMTSIRITSKIFWERFFCLIASMMIATACQAAPIVFVTACLPGV